MGSGSSKQQSFYDNGTYMYPQQAVVYNQQGYQQGYQQQGYQQQGYQQQPNAGYQQALRPGTYYRDPFTDDIYMFQDDGQTQKQSANTGEELMTLPWPRPPASRRGRVFQLSNYKKIDEYVRQVPPSAAAQDYPSLVSKLMSACGARDEMGRLRALFAWLTSQDVYNMTVNDLPNRNSPLDHLLQIRFGTNSRATHSYIFYQLCKAAGIRSAFIRGINKSAAYELGKPLDRQAMTSSWNAVYVCGEWRLVDAFWASTCLVGKKTDEWQLLEVDGAACNEEEEEENEGHAAHFMNEFFFLADPDQLIYTHFPDEPLWQLLAESWSASDFEQSIYVRERFHEMSLEVTPECSTCRIAVPTGEAKLLFNLPTGRWSKQSFQYFFFKQGREDVDVDKFVMYEKRKQKLQYTIQFPVTGCYKIQVFANERDLFGEEDIQLAFAYVFDVTKAKKGAKPLPDNPQIGWGPGAEAESVGLEAVTHDDALIETRDGIVEMRLRSKNDLSLLQNVLGDGFSAEQLRRYCVVRKEGNEFVISLRLPAAGEFALKLHANAKGKDDGQLLDNVCNYLVRVLRGDTAVKQFPLITDGMLGTRPSGEKLGVTTVPTNNGIINSNDGTYELRIKKGKASSLVCELTSNDGVHADCVSREESGSEVIFRFRLPREGEYGVNVYSKSGANGLIESVQNCLLVSTSASNNHFSTPPVVETSSMLVHTSKATVRVPRLNGNALATVQRNLSTKAGVKVTLERTENEDVFTLDLPEHGEYELTLFSEENGAMTRTQQIHVVYAPQPNKPKQQAAPVSEEEKKLERDLERLLGPIRAAMEQEDAGSLQAALQQFHASGLQDPRGRVKRAQDFLNYLLIKDKLTQGMATKNLELLESGIDAADQNDAVAKKLGIHLAMAKRARDSLRRINRLRHAILDLDQRTIAELKSYGTPPEIVFSVMKATFLLLGNKPREMKDWNQLKILMNKTGRESLKRRVSDFNVDTLEPELAAKASPLLSFSLEAVRDVSSGAATFFVWAQGMIEEVQNR